MSPFLLKLFPFLAWRDRVNGATLRADAQAGLVGALVVLPQGVAYATLAGMPPQYGLYCAVVPVIVAALWGSSWHQVSGPTNTISLAVLAIVAPLALPFGSDYIRLVLTLALMVGLIELAMGVARLGWLVNFISHSVVVAFTAGAAVLIIAAQLGNFFGTPKAANAGFFPAVQTFLGAVRELDPWTTAAGIVTLAVAIAMRRYVKRIPYMIGALVAGSVFAWLVGRFGGGQIPTVGALGSALPQWSWPSLDPEDWRRLAPGAVALTVLALAQAVAVARAVAARSDQRLDASQEFVGQGLSNVAAAFTSAYPSSGSFNRIWVNYDAGARTPLAAVLSALFLVAILFAVAPLAAHLPLAVMAALLFVVAWGLVDVDAIRQIVRTSRGEALVVAITFIATITIQLEFAIFVGVLASLFVYLHRTTHPALTRVMPDPASAQRRFEPAGPDTPRCPQLDILRLDGSLFFGAVEHVRDELAAARAARPGVRNVLLVGSGVNFVDVAGGDLLVREAALARDAGGALWLSNLKPSVRRALERGGFLDGIGAERIFDTKDAALRAIYATLETAVCRDCRVRVFVECNVALPGGALRQDASG